MPTSEIASRPFRPFLFFPLAWLAAVAACQPPAIDATATAATRDPSRARDAAIDAVFAAYAHDHGPGCAVGVYEAGQIVHARGFGVADLEHDVPVTDTTVFDLGSVSKQFTAAAIVLLAQEGKLSLDDDIRDHVPEVPSYGKPITLRHLLHHTSGLRDYTDLLAIGGHDDADLTTEEDALFAVTHQKALNFPTGTEWSYSNTGYFLLSVVVRRVSGKTLAAFEKERIFDPLGMSDTHVHDDHRRLVPRRDWVCEGRWWATGPRDERFRADRRWSGDDDRGRSGALGREFHLGEGRGNTPARSAPSPRTPRRRDTPHLRNGALRRRRCRRRPRMARGLLGRLSLGDRAISRGEPRDSRPVQLGRNDAGDARDVSRRGASAADRGGESGLGLGDRARGPCGNVP